MCGPYTILDIPKFDIDYRGLIAYARQKGVQVFELTDSEKNLFIRNSNMEEVKSQAIKI